VDEVDCGEEIGMGAAAGFFAVERVSWEMERDVVRLGVGDTTGMPDGPWGDHWTVRGSAMPME